MMKILTKRECKERLKELLKFCKENQMIMWNFMLMIQRDRKSNEYKLFQKEE